MEILARSFCAEELRRAVKFGLFPDAYFYPNLIDGLLPIRKQAHAVTGRLNCIKMLLQIAERQIFVDVLLHGEPRLKIKRELGNYSQCAQTYDRAVKRITILLARQFHNVARRIDELQSRNGC